MAPLLTEGIKYVDIQFRIVIRTKMFVQVFARRVVFVGNYLDDFEVALRRGCRRNDAHLHKVNHFGKGESRRRFGR
jgi:hypothetical protein